MSGRLSSTGLAAGDQERAPIFETLARYARSGIYGFHTPGHKSGRFAALELTDLVGTSGLALDLPAMTATDNTFQPTGCIRDAQLLAAEVFGAGQTFFLSAGSTLGVAAALLATVPQGHTVALPRNIHRSVVAGLPGNRRKVKKSDSPSRKQENTRENHVLHSHASRGPGSDCWLQEE